MSYPAGVVTRDVVVGPFLDERGRPITQGSATLIADRVLVWHQGASDQAVLFSESESKSLDANGTALFTRPIDQSGFWDGRGGTVRGWTYTARVNLPKLDKLPAATFVLPSGSGAFRPTFDASGLVRGGTVSVVDTATRAAAEAAAAQAALSASQAAAFGGTNDSIVATILSAAGGAARAVLNALYQRYGVAKVLSGTGIDLTGATDSRAAVQAFLDACSDGDTVTMVVGSVIALSAPITVSKKILLGGLGTLNFTGGVFGAAALTLAADGIVVEHIRIVNVPQTASAVDGTGKQYGIFIAANGVHVEQVTTRYFQQAITVSPFGEFHDYFIHGCHVLDVIGSGLGPSVDPGGSNIGEDRGDGIVSWGAAGSIIGCRVTAMAGTDARIGIHTEGLANLEATAYAHSSSLVVISGNVVTGQFRRGIVAESVPYTAIVGNAIADPTWWAIALIDSQHCIVGDNVVKWTRKPTDNQGFSWNPRRAIVMVYGYCKGSTIHHTIASVVTGALLPNGFCVQTDGLGPADDVTFDANQVDDPNQAIDTGFYCDGSSGSIARLKLVNNRISGFTAYGANLFKVGDFAVEGNRFDGKGGSHSALGVRADAGAGAHVAGNEISWTATAIQLYGRNTAVRIVDNGMFEANIGIDLYQTAAATVAINRAINVATPISTAAGTPVPVTAGNNF